MRDCPFSSLMLGVDDAVWQRAEASAKSLDIGVGDFLRHLFAATFERTVERDLERLLAAAIGEEDLDAAPAEMVTASMVKRWSLPERDRNTQPDSDRYLCAFYLDADKKPALLVRTLSDAVQLLADVQSVRPTELVTRYLSDGAQADLRAWLVS